ncbi:MAG: SRPBCC domain-containing protein [Chloroflexi bacterium]|nr:SRPBCC domain-containing protein [Chloroflexota bacterium]
MKRFVVTAEFFASPQVLFDAWLDGEQHGAMTQAPATASRDIAGIFTAHDGYINGINLELEEGKRILQTWRTSQFADTDSDSSIEVMLEAISAGTRLTLTHWNVPDDQADGYESGWQDFYFTPMQEYFSGDLGE